MTNEEIIKSLQEELNELREVIESSNKLVLSKNKHKFKSVSFIKESRIDKETNLPSFIKNNSIKEKVHVYQTDAITDKKLEPFARFSTSSVKGYSGISPAKISTLYYDNCQEMQLDPNHFINDSEITKDTAYRTSTDYTLLNSDEPIYMMDETNVWVKLRPSRFDALAKNRNRCIDLTSPKYDGPKPKTPAVVQVIRSIYRREHTSSLSDVNEAVTFKNALLTNIRLKETNHELVSDFHIKNIAESNSEKNIIGQQANTHTIMHIPVSYISEEPIFIEELNIFLCTCIPKGTTTHPNSSLDKLTSNYVLYQEAHKNNIYVSKPNDSIVSALRIVTNETIYEDKRYVDILGKVQIVPVIKSDSEPAGIYVYRNDDENGIPTRYDDTPTNRAILGITDSYENRKERIAREEEERKRKQQLEDEERKKAYQREEEERKLKFILDEEERKRRLDEEKIAEARRTNKTKSFSEGFKLGTAIVALVTTVLAACIKWVF